MNEQEFEGFAGNQNFYKHMTVDPGHAPKEPTQHMPSELKIIELLKTIKDRLLIIIALLGIIAGASIIT